MKLISKPLIPLCRQTRLADRVILRLQNEVRFIYRKELRRKTLRMLPVYKMEDCFQPAIHMLVCKRDYEMAIVSAMTLNALGNKGHLFIFHDDGSIDHKMESSIHHYLPGIKLIRRKSADKIIEETLCSYPAMLAFRRQQVLALKLIDVPFFSGQERIGYMDSDILFFQYPAVFFHQLSDKTNVNVFNKDIANAYITDQNSIEERLGIKLTSRINSGLWVINKMDFQFSVMESWLKNPLILSYLSDYRLEQTMTAMLAGISVAETEYFPVGYDVSFEKDPLHSVCKHYVGKIRYGYELEGLHNILNSNKHKY